jgi:hypothetical protein
MFNLDQCIAEWRQEMIAAGIESPVPLDELESHLRDDVNEQMRSGWSAPQAFEAAVQRLGHAHLLKLEFKKVGTGEGIQMKRIVAVIAALFGMVFGLSMVLPQLGQWSRTGVMHSQAFLLFGAALILMSGSAALFGIRRHRETRGRNWISVGIIAAWGFYVMPLILAFLQAQKTNAMGWLFCAGLAATSLLFFGSCFYFNRHLPAASVHES